MNWPAYIAAIPCHHERMKALEFECPADKLAVTIAWLTVMFSAVNAAEYSAIRTRVQKLHNPKKPRKSKRKKPEYMCPGNYKIRRKAA